MAGRRPKPTALHLLAGNPSHLSNEELKGKSNPSPEVGAPEMPKGMSKIARREWNQMVPILMHMNVLSKIDKMALAAYCEQVSLWETARNLYLKEGITVTIYTETGSIIKAHPAVAIANTALKTMKSFLIEFGLTPASRRNIKLGDGPKKNDPMAEFLDNTPEAIDPAAMTIDDDDQVIQ